MLYLTSGFGFWICGFRILVLLVCVLHALRFCLGFWCVVVVVFGVGLVAHAISRFLVLGFVCCRNAGSGWFMVVCWFSGFVHEFLGWWLSGDLAPAGFVGFALAMVVCL